MNIERSIKFVFEDSRWSTKLLIGVLMALLSVFIIPGLMLTGYMIAIIRRVMTGDKQPLPEWNDWGKLLRDGLLVTIALFLYSLPFLLILGLIFGATGVLGALTGSDSDLFTAGLFGAFGLVACLTLLVAIVMLFITPAVYIQYAIKDDFGACFRFGEVFAIAREHMADILITVAVSLVAGFAISLVAGALNIVPVLGTIASFFISIAATPYLMMVGGHLYGQIAAKVLPGQSGGKYIPEEPTIG